MPLKMPSHLQRELEGGRRVADEIARPGEVNAVPFDRFTLAHFGAGVALGVVGAPWWVVIGGALSWELLERPLKRTFPGLFPNPSQDTTTNAVTDVAAALTGAGLAMRIAGGMRAVSPGGLYLGAASALLIGDGRVRAVDPGTFAYAGAGAAMRHFGAPWWAMIPAALAWELAERPLRRSFPKLFTHREQDTVPNAIVDIAAVVAGGALMQLSMGTR